MVSATTKRKMTILVRIRRTAISRVGAHLQRSDSGTVSKVCCSSDGICNATQDMERNWEEASSQRRPVCRVPEIMVDTSGERVAGDGLHVQDQPETAGRASAIARDAGTIPLADTTQGKSKGGV